MATEAIVNFIAPFAGLFLAGVWAATLLGWAEYRWYGPKGKPKSRR